MTESQITIAITVYNRRTYLTAAVNSALAQRKKTLGPRVIVVEDCGPDESLRPDILAEFGDAISYHRNSHRRGLFDNWNACLELCETEWLCILHDDDFLEPAFCDDMKELSAAAPGRALYYGRCRVVDANGKQVEECQIPSGFAWHELPLKTWARYDPVCFPGQLMNATAARAVGGFRARSRYCGDWEMWFKLASTGGAAATNRVVANYREHHSIGRGTTNVDISGRKYALVNIQRRRHLARLRNSDNEQSFNRRELLAESPMSAIFLLAHGLSFSARMLRYNVGLFLLSAPPHSSYRLLQALVRLLGWRVMRPLSFLYRLVRR